MKKKARTMMPRCYHPIKYLLKRKKDMRGLATAILRKKNKTELEKSGSLTSDNTTKLEYGTGTKIDS